MSLPSGGSGGSSKLLDHPALGSITRIPFLGVAVRVFALFQAYNVLTKDNLQPLTFAALSFTFVSLVHLALGSVDLRRLKSLPTTTSLLLGLHGVWSAINYVALLTSLVKLHPLRFAVGEYFEVALAYVFFNPSRGDDVTSGGGKSKKGVLMFAVAAVMLGWASNLYTYTAEAGSSRSQQPDAQGGGEQTADPEDLHRVMDSVGGMLLLGLYVVSEVFKKKLRARLLLQVGEEELHASPDVICILFGAVCLVPCSIFLSLAGGEGGSIFAGGLSSLISVVFNATMLMLVPSVIALRRTRSQGGGSSGGFSTSGWKMTAELRVLATLASALVLHLCYHTHYAPAPMGDQEGTPQHVDHTHPVLHLDNILVVVCAGLLSLGLRLVAISAGRGAYGNGGGGLTGSSPLDDTALLFAPISTQESSLFASIFENPKERKLFLFFILTLFFMFVELLYGIHVNSLGLVSDSFHMLLDSASIAIGLYAAHMAKWRANESHPFGYGRYEILSGFTNGVLLVFIGVYVFVEAIARFREPPQIDQNYLLGVSVLGLFVNIAGLALFWDGGHGHSHGGQQCGGHGHSHGDAAGEDINLRGVYLHILCDFLGSVSVIVSSIVVNMTGWMVADPICSAFISGLIFLASIPIISSSGAALLQATPPQLCAATVQEQLERLEGVKKVRDLHLWTLATTPELQVVCTVNLECSPLDAQSVGGKDVHGAAQLRAKVVSVLRANNVQHEEHISVELDFGAATR